VGRRFDPDRAHVLKICHFEYVYLIEAKALLLLNVTFNIQIIFQH
jgi:hypothetical protein